MSSDGPLMSAADEIELLTSIINSLPPSAHTSTPDSLTTGHRIWSILQHCSPTDFRNSLPADASECDKWVARHENLKRVAKALSDILTQNGVSGIPRVDLKALAERQAGARAELVRLLRMFVCTTSKEPLVDSCVPPIMELPQGLQGLYMMIVQEYPGPEIREDGDEDDGGEGDGSLRGEGEGEVFAAAGTATPARKTVEARRDPELYREEVETAKDKVIVELQGEKAELEDTIRHLENRIERLRKNNQDLDEKIKFVEDSLRKNETQGSQEAHIYSLETKIESQNGLIEEQEEQLSKLQRELERVTSEINALRRANEDIQPLRDQVDELQHQYEEASRKANTVDKYAQKLEQMKAMERNYRDLQGQYEELRHDLGAGTNAGTEIAGLQRQIMEYKRLLPQLETERYELSGMLTSVQEDAREIQEQLNAKKEELTRAEETITELRNGQGMSPIDATTAGLASEMDESERKAELDAMDPEERSKVLLKSLSEERAKSIHLASQLDDQKTLYTQSQKRVEDLRAEKSALERAGKTQDEVPPTPPPKDDVVDEDAEAADDEKSQLEAEVEKLKERIKLMETENPQAKKAADAALMRQELLSLRQESKLIASAWYGLNRRSQLNSAILQKKTEVPQGFLGRARNQVEKAARVRGR